MRLHSISRFCFSAVGPVLLLASPALAHIRIYPTESAPGGREKYTMRVPNSSKVFSTKIEGEFPPELNVNEFEFKPGWDIEIKRDAKGKIIGAVWTGRMRPTEFVDFGMMCVNPKEAVKLVWKFVQYYEDGTKEEFTGPEGSPYPSPVVTLKKVSP